MDWWSHPARVSNQRVIVVPVINGETRFRIHGRRSAGDSGGSDGDSDRKRGRGPRSCRQRIRNGSLMSSEPFIRSSGA